MGLYFKTSIVLFYFPIFLIYLFKPSKTNNKFKLFSLKRYSRYLKIIFTKDVLKIIIIVSIISNSNILYQNFKFETKFKNLRNKNIEVEGLVIQKIEDKYIVKINNNKLYLIGVKKDLQYGDKILITGMYLEPKRQTNYKGFDYKNYLKTLKIYGTIKASNIKIIEKNKGNFILKYSNKLNKWIKHRIENSKLSDDEKGVLKPILIGNKENTTEYLIENFSKSNISHILAISGMHISYIIIFLTVILNKIIGKHYSKPIISILIFLYMCIVNFTPSVVRAGITGIIVVMSGFFYRQNDWLEEISLSLILQLLYNPFQILNIGLQLSYAGTIGIVLFMPILNKYYKTTIERAENRALRKNKKHMQKIIKILNTKIVSIIKDATIVTISATIFIIPIMAIKFNTVGISSLIISILASFIIGPIIVLGLIFVILKVKLVQILLKISLKILIYVSSIGGKIPLNQIYVVSSNIFQILIYYLIIFSFMFLLKINLEKNKNAFQKRTINIYQFIKYKIIQNKKRLLSFILILCTLQYLIVIIPKSLKIYFIDINQGDSTLIVTPMNKTILIDGGGSENFDVGKKTLIPYLLDRKIKKLDYVIISHFDLDHVGGLITVMEELQVKTVLISKQAEDSQNFKKFKEIVKQKRISVAIVGTESLGNPMRINIEKDLYFDIIWPDNSNLISENTLNNNSIVCKLNYKSFSMMFTGDIEEIAEKQILQTYKNNIKILNSTVLKVAHHGSKTSSTPEFLKAVNPKVALIGVGENNKFGHPNEEVLKRLENLDTKIYRTDKNGEITIKVNKKGQVRIQKFVK